MLQAAQTSDVFAVWREPLQLTSPRVEVWTPGKSILHAVRNSDFLPPDFEQVGIVTINGHEINRKFWASVKPHSAANDAVVLVTFQVPIKGGKKGGVKQVFALVASLALMTLSQGILAGKAVGLLGKSFAAGTAGAKLLAAGVSVVGGLVVNALTSTPARATADTGGEAKSLDPASVSGNLLSVNAPLPVVIGTRKIFPPFLSEPIIELIGQDEYLTATLGLAGPHKLEKIRVGSASASDVVGSDLVIETYDGLPDSEKINIPRRYGKTFQIGTDLSVHGTKADDASKYDNPLPVYHAFSTAEDPDETWLHLLSSGLVKDDISTEKLRIPFRIRMRRRGETTWRYLPELHYMDNAQSQHRFQIKFRFGVGYSFALPSPPSNRGWVEARKANPAAANSVAYAADAYFSAGAGNDVYVSGNETTTNVRNVLLIDDTAIFYLDAASWTPGIYDIEVMRGATFRNSQYVSAAYTLSGSVWDFYAEPLGADLPLSRQGIADRMTLVRAVNIKNKTPINEKNLAIISVKARNRALDQISVVASGYVRDYVAGQGWVNVTTTSNPAPHYRNALIGGLNFDPMPEALLWDESLIAWRQFCIDKAYTCDLIAEGSGLFDLLRIIASCGYASPYQSEKWGVITDYDRSAEEVTQVFTSRVVRDFEIRKAFTRLPSGLRPNFKDQDYDYSGKQIVVYRDDVLHPDNRTEQVDYLGLVNRDKIIARARFDLKQAKYRNTVYSFTTNASFLVCRRGSLIGLHTDAIRRYSQSARIAQIITNGSGHITGFVLDTVVNYFNNGDMLSITDMISVSDMSAVGLKSKLIVRRRDGTTARLSLSGATTETNTLTLAAAITTGQSNYAVGNLVIIGQSEKEFRRLIVSGIQPGKNETATITAVDEAPEIWG